MKASKSIRIHCSIYQLVNLTCVIKKHRIALKPMMQALELPHLAKRHVLRQTMQKKVKKQAYNLNLRILV